MSEEDLSYSYFTTKNQEQGASSDMSTSLLHLAKWLCHTITRNEFDSLMVILLEIQGGSHPDFTFKAERPSPNYRNFRQVDAHPSGNLPPTAPPWGWTTGGTGWRPASVSEAGPCLTSGRVPEHCRCEVCGAPHNYLYLNEGRKATQYRCKVCSHLGAIERRGHGSQSGLWCPTAAPASTDGRSVGKRPSTSAGTTAAPTI